jgi:hypothetical protein
MELPEADDPAKMMKYRGLSKSGPCSDLRPISTMEMPNLK